MRKLTPLTAGLYNVQHGVCQFALAPLPIPHSRIQWLYFFPLAVCQVRRVRLAPCSYFFHAAIIPRFTYEDKLLEPSEEVAVPSEIGQPIHEETTADADSESDEQEIMSELAAPLVEEKDNVVSCVPEETADEGSENQPKLNSCPETAEGGQAAGENDKSED